MRTTLVTALAALAVVATAPGSARAEGEHRELGPHVHGHGNSRHRGREQARFHGAGGARHGHRRLRACRHHRRAEGRRRQGDGTARQAARGVQAAERGGLHRAEAKVAIEPEHHHDGDEDHDADHDHDEHAGHNQFHVTYALDCTRAHQPHVDQLRLLQVFAGAARPDRQCRDREGAEQVRGDPRQARARPRRHDVMQRAAIRHGGTRYRYDVGCPLPLAGAHEPSRCHDRRLCARRARSACLLVGPSGTGKSTFLQPLVRDRHAAGGQHRRARHRHRAALQLRAATISAPSTSASSSRCSTCCPMARSSTTCSCP